MAKTQVASVIVTPRKGRDMLQIPASARKAGRHYRWIKNEPEVIDRFVNEEGYILSRDKETNEPFKRRELILVEKDKRAFDEAQLEKAKEIRASRQSRTASLQARAELEEYRRELGIGGDNRILGGVEITGAGTGLPADI